MGLCNGHRDIQGGHYTSGRYWGLTGVLGDL